MSYSMIAAIGQNNELGYKNDLIWRFSGDMKFFRDTTIGHTIIMGRKTFDSLPRLLPNRKHIVLSSSTDFPKEVTVYKDIDNLLFDYDKTNDELFVIGGASIYKLFLEYSNNLYLTEIEDTFSPADAYFPYFDRDEYNSLVLGNNEEDGIAYKHVLYRKK